MAELNRQVRRVAGADTYPDLTDAGLLAAYAANDDADALAAIIDRHGPMVYATCRRVLGDPNEADDAFQAVFLVLIRKAATVRGAELAGWLYGVALRTAKASRKLAARRQRLDQKYRAANAREAAEDPDLLEAADLRAVLDRELARLTSSARTAIVLCDLEGRTRKQAAAELGWPEGTVAARLTRAREVLARRLARLGVVPTVALMVGLLAREAKGKVPPAVRETTLKAVLKAGPVATGAAKLAAVAGAGAVNALFWGGAAVLTVGVIVVAVLLSRPGPRPAGPPGGEPGPGAGEAGTTRPRPATPPAVPPGVRPGDWLFLATEPGGKTVGVRDSDGRAFDLPSLGLPDGAVLSSDGKRAAWVGTADDGSRGAVRGQLLVGDVGNGRVRGTWVNQIRGRAAYPVVRDPDWVPDRNKIIVVLDPDGPGLPPGSKSVVMTVNADADGTELEIKRTFTERVFRPKMTKDCMWWACLHDAGKAGNVQLHNLVIYGGTKGEQTIEEGVEVLDFTFCPATSMFMAYSVAGKGLRVIHLESGGKGSPFTTPAAAGLDEAADFGHLFCRPDSRTIGFRPVYVRGPRADGIRGPDQVGFFHMMDGGNFTYHPLPANLRPVGWTQPAGPGPTGQRVGPVRAPAAPAARKGDRP
jgi:RNA polymerase sigma factor (sigma-70 family)